MKHIQDVVDNLIADYGFNNPFEICKLKDITCKRIKLHNDIKGYVVSYENNWVIMINNDLSYSEAVKTCAHELGHIFLHDKYSSLYLSTSPSIDRTKQDAEADAFANILINYYK